MRRRKMRELRFRQPVVCQNGHKAFWFFEIDQSLMPFPDQIINHGVPQNQTCSCSKFDYEEGWRRAGGDQQDTGIDVEKESIYEGDVVEFEYQEQIAFTWSRKLGVIKWNDLLARFTIVYFDGFNEYELPMYKSIKRIVGSVYLNSELIKER